MNRKFNPSNPDFQPSGTYIDASPLEVLLIHWYRKLTQNGKIYALRKLWQTVQYERECQKHVEECRERDRERETRTEAAA